MQVLKTLLNIACNMQNMQNNMHDMQNMQMLFPICRICTAHFADACGTVTVTVVTSSSHGNGPAAHGTRSRIPSRSDGAGPVGVVT
jgi:hypothetical protein